MTKIRILSDLHLEFGPLTLEPAGEDVIVLAGDIDVGVKGGIWAIDVANRLGVPVVMVAGNHEFYGGDRPNGDMSSVYERLQKLSLLSGGAFTFLQNSSRIVAGVHFYGATLWTDFDLFGDPAKAMTMARVGMNDYRRIRLNALADFYPEDAAEEHKESLQFLRWETHVVPSDKPSVIVSHHAPSKKSIAGRYADDAYSPAYASNLDDFVTESKVDLWVHGHVHHSFGYQLGKTKVRTNPRGYFGYEENPEFNPNLIVEVGVEERAAA